MRRPCYCPSCSYLGVLVRTVPAVGRWGKCPACEGTKLCPACGGEDPGCEACGGGLLCPACDGRGEGLL